MKRTEKSNGQPERHSDISLCGISKTCHSSLRESDCRPDRANRRRAGTAVATEDSGTMETVQLKSSGLRCSGINGMSSKPFSMQTLPPPTNAIDQERSEIIRRVTQRSVGNVRGRESAGSMSEFASPCATFTVFAAPKPSAMWSRTACRQKSIAHSEHAVMYRLDWSRFLPTSRSRSRSTDFHLQSTRLRYLIEYYRLGESISMSLQCVGPEQ